MKVLIADDSDFMRTVLKDIVNQSLWSGSEILEASDGVQAISIINKDSPDIVLLDVIMPNKDGIEVLRSSNHNTMTVIIVSSVDQASVIDEAKSLGVKNYITKPFDKKMVIGILDSLFPKHD